MSASPNRRQFALGALATLSGLAAAGASAAGDRQQAARDTLFAWYRLVLKLVRHTPTYSPPVASRAFAYLGVTAFEAAASGSRKLLSLAGQLNGLPKLPQRAPSEAYDEAIVLQSALAFAVQSFFENTGPAGQRAIKAMQDREQARVSEGIDLRFITASENHGRAIAAHILNWSEDDGGAAIENMGFPLEYRLGEGKARWVPTSFIAQQQRPLLPSWGKNRTFAMPAGSACPLPPPPAYSEDKASIFYKEAFEVYDFRKNLTQEQRTIARFWSDDPMLSPTPPGHWISIALSILDTRHASLEKSVDVLARLGVTVADAFIACWESKYEYDLLRPVTYIKRVIDPKWEALLITPPFPEYPSGHSTQSAAAATVLTQAFGKNFAFEDKTHMRDGLAPRAFASFWAAAEEAGISRLYGGIHFRAAIERGLEQGRCVGAFAGALRTTA